MTGENYFASAFQHDFTNGTANPLMTNSIWVANKTPANRFHFMTVIYPVPPGEPEPTISRLDDYTVSVTKGGQRDVISFDPQTTNACTLIVNSPFLGSSMTPLPAPPTPLYTDSRGSSPDATPAVH